MKQQSKQLSLTPFDRLSIGPSYNTVRYRGAVYGDKIVQEARP